MAAVYPAGPDPMMIRSRTPSCSAGGIAGSACSAVTAEPGVGWSVVTGGTTRIVGVAFPVRTPSGVPAGPSRARPVLGVEDGGLLQDPALAWRALSSRRARAEGPSRVAGEEVFRSARRRGDDLGDLRGESAVRRRQ